MIGLDTNVLVRYIVQDDAVQSALATRLIEQQCSPDRPGFIGLVALIELVWVSESCYAAAKIDIVKILRLLLSTKQLLIQDAEIVWQALRLFESSDTDFVDCLTERISAASGCEKTVTFDKKAARAGMVLLK